MASLLRYATGIAPLEAYAVDSGKVGTPSAVIEDLTEALTRAIEELTRPIDAIKHQAKTVTVGISRSEDALFEAALVRQVLATGVARDRLSYRVLRTLAGLDPAVAEVTGFTRYRIEGNLADATAVRRCTSSTRAASPPTSSRGPSATRGCGAPSTRWSSDREVMVARGRSDGRTVMIVPESKDTHVDRARAPPCAVPRPAGGRRARAGVLKAYRDRYDALRDAVTETEPPFDDERARHDFRWSTCSPRPCTCLADHWRVTG